MKTRIPILAAALLCFAGVSWAGPYSPTEDEPGSVAIRKDSPLFTAWATSVLGLQRGPVDITVPGGAVPTQGSNEDVLGMADADDDTTDVISLGDGGWITLGFTNPITNGAGADFAVFENGFMDDSNPGFYFFELAFVEVSSNGTDFFRFNSVSLTATSAQINGFGTLDPTDIHNLAGRDSAGYGTPFDLNELAGVSPLLNINAIQYVRIRDVVGSINPLYSTTDSLGNVINDPWKTNFPQGGFDLDAIGVIHAVPEPGSTALLALGFGAAGLLRRRRVGRNS